MAKQGKLIALEGSEAAGKKTQALLLVDRLIQSGRRAEYIHFPTYQSTRFGDMITRYLRGEFGPKESISPEVGSLLYSLDRYQVKEVYQRKLADGIWLVADRYTPSNLFQAAKAPTTKEQLALAEWISRVEERMPQPDLVIVFDAPAVLSSQAIENRGAKTDLGGRTRDIHEEDSAYLERVRTLYRLVAKRRKWPLIAVAEQKSGTLAFRSREAIHAEVWRLLKQRKIL